MRPVALSDEIAVGEMPTADEIIVLAKAGFRSLLNVQPDGEVLRLLSSAEIEAGAVAAGLNYAHIPIVSRRVPDATVVTFAQAMVTLPRPIYACCYSGARAAAAWALAVAPTMAPFDVVANCDAAGFDITSLLPEIQRRHDKQASPLPGDDNRDDARPPTAGVTEPSPTPVDAVESAAAKPAAPTAPETKAVSATPNEPNAAGNAPTSAPTAATASAKIIFPRAAGAGGFAVSG